MRDTKIQKIFKKCVRDTALEAVVRNITVVAGMLPPLLSEKIDAANPRIYITTRVIKHLYDKKPAEEFDFVLENIPNLLAHPDRLYRNKGDKRGQFCLMKQIEGREYFVSLELADGKYGKELQLVTAFRVRSEPYLKEYDLLWSRRDGEIHSS